MVCRDAESVTWRVLILLALAAVSTLALAMPPDPLSITARVGDVRFSHHAHAAVACASCHHNASGARVTTGCHDCHRPGARVPVNTRDVFHGLCIGCHLQYLKSGHTTGPAKRCSQCHRQ
jgi:hypothetical protein